MAFRQLDGDPFGTAKKDELAPVKVEHIGSRFAPCCAQPSQLALQVVDREAYVVEADSAQVLDGRVGHWVRCPVREQLDFSAWHRACQHQGHVLGLDPRHPHVGGEDLTRDDDRAIVLETEQGEESFGGSNVADKECDVVEVAQHYGVSPLGDSYASSPPQAIVLV